MKKNETPTEPSYWARSWYWWVIFATAFGLYGFAAWQVYEHTLKSWEFTTLVLVNHWPEMLRPAAMVITMLGSIWAAAVLVMGAFVLRLYQLAWRLALSVLTVYGLTLASKEFLERPQPSMLGVDVQARLVEVGPSFPSTHLAVATVLTITLLPYAPRWWRWPIVLSWVGAVAVARMYLGVNAPLDILGGLALGMAVVSFWEILPGPIRKFLRIKNK